MIGEFFVKAWENKEVKIVSVHGEVIDTIVTDVLWNNDPDEWLHVDYKGRRIPCRRLHLTNPDRIDYEAYV